MVSYTHFCLKIKYPTHVSIFKSSFFCLAMWISTTLHNTPIDTTVHFTVWYTLRIPTAWILTDSTSLVILFINIIVSNTIYYIIEYCDYYNLTNCKDVPEIITILHNLLIKKWLSIFVLLILE